jgi:hypothetical protein
MLAHYRLMAGAKLYEVDLSELPRQPL